MSDRRRQRARRRRHQRRKAERYALRARLASLLAVEPTSWAFHWRTRNHNPRRLVRRLEARHAL